MYLYATFPEKSQRPATHIFIKCPVQSVQTVAAPVRMNFGGFVPLSTVDWRGHSVSVVFFRGCPIKCWYCHNQHLLSGDDWRSVDDIIAMIREASLLISGVVFSGGEATMQLDALMCLASGARGMGLKTGLHTNGVYPDAIRSLVRNRLIDYIALDIKAESNLYTLKGRDKGHVAERVRESLQVCTDAWHGGQLGAFSVVITLFPFYGEEVVTIARDVAVDVTLVLQQGRVTGIREQTADEIQNIADRLDRPVWIRTQEEGEFYYEGTGNRGNARLG